MKSRKRRIRASAVRTVRPRVGDIMKTDIRTVEPKISAEAAWAMMQKDGIAYLVVIDGRRKVGTLALAQLGEGADGSEARSRRMVEDLMTPRVVSIAPEAALDDALNLMRDEEVNSLLVEEDGRPIGVAVRRDVEVELGRDPLRAPLPGWLPRSEKPQPGRPLQPVPAHIRVIGASLDELQRRKIRAELGVRLGKFGDAVERVTVRVDDVNGLRGGVGQACRIKVVLSDHPSVVFETRGKSLDTAVRSSLLGIEQAVMRKLERTRMKPIQQDMRSRSQQRTAAGA